jgi:restriction system protein
MPSADVTVAEAIHEACSPSDFEALVATLYENEGYETQVKPDGPDGGVDVLAERHGRMRAVQCKRYAGGNSVGGPTVRQTIGAAQTHGADAVSVVTTSRFTSSAKSVVVDIDGIDVELVDGSDLLDWLDGAMSSFRTGR